MGLFNFLRSSKFKQLGSEVFWITFGQILFVLGSIVSVKILTNLLTPEEYGNLALALTIVGLGGQLYIGPISQGALRYYSVALGKQDFSNFFNAVLKLFRNGTIIFGGMFVFIGLILAATGHYRWIVISLFAAVLSTFQGINKIAGNIQNAARNRIIVAWHDSSMQWLKVLLAYLFIVMIAASSEVALVGYILATIIVLISQIYFLKENILNVHNTKFELSDTIKIKYWINNIFSYSWPFLIWGIFAWAQTSGDKWLLGATMSSYSVGLYAVLYKIGFQPAVLMSNLSNRIIAPIIFARVGDFSDKKKVKKTFDYHVLIICLILAITFVTGGLTYIVSDLIFDVLIAPKYHEVSNYLWLMVIAGGFYASAEIGVLNLMASFDTKRLLFPKIAGSVIAVVSYYIGASQYGIYGLVIANLIYTFIYLFIISSMIYLNYETIE